MNASPPLYKQIYDYIIGQVKSGVLAPGDRVPSEKELAYNFQVSRITSKKALDLLSQEQVIERIQGKGSFIAHSRLEPVIRNTEPDIRKETYLIGLIIPDFGDSYGTGIVRAIEGACNNNRSHLIIKLSYGSSTLEEQAITDLMDLDVDGLIVFPISGRHYNQKILELVIKNYPLVLVDRHLKGIPASSVSTDNRLATLEAAKHLWSLGHERIGFISRPPEGTSAIEERIEGYQMAYSQQALQLDPRLFLTNISEHNLEGSMRSIQDFIVRHPDVTAFVVSEYVLAAVLKYALEDIEKSIPDDYSVICFDSPPTCAGKPLYTHIRQNENGIGKKAIELLLEQLRGNIVPQNTFIAFELVDGQSTKKIDAT
ncbi:GntR family transcriptional regulator [Paenibacillus abyssi]|uniref:LacI family transcriptional regulator n=1 Tax=Paenibacillus abyssi TaxID=1340531 RepID=A0A917G7F2_9BACL|nr:GntR family transcriptional regulator [Paenibacillus abyssi]GGG25610.1 LacI family transcriptional regulator [Paenibacillus abyssi]